MTVMQPFLPSTFYQPVNITWISREKCACDESTFFSVDKDNSRDNNNSDRPRKSFRRTTRRSSEDDDAAGQPASNKTVFEREK